MKNKEKFNNAYIKGRDDILKLIPEKVKTVLDIGCNIGTLGKELKNKFNTKVIGIEIDKEMAKIAKTKLDKVIIGDLDKLNLKRELKKNYFDCIILGDVLEHLKDPWNLLKEIKDYLKKNGVIIISIPNVRHFTTLINLIFKGYWPYRKRGLHDKTHLRFFTLKNIVELCNYAELKITYIKRNYRLIEKPHKINGFVKFFVLPFIKEFLVFQYILILKTNENETN